MRPSQVKNFEAKLFSKTEYSTNEEPNIMTFEGLFHNLLTVSPLIHWLSNYFTSFVYPSHQ